MRVVPARCLNHVFEPVCWVLGACCTSLMSKQCFWACLFSAWCVLRQLEQIMQRTVLRRCPSSSSVVCVWLCSFFVRDWCLEMYSLHCLLCHSREATWGTHPGNHAQQIQLILFREKSTDTIGNPQTHARAWTNCIKTLLERTQRVLSQSKKTTFVEIYLLLEPCACVVWT